MKRSDYIYIASITALVLLWYRQFNNNKKIIAECNKALDTCYTNSNKTITYSTNENL